MLVSFSLLRLCRICLEPHGISTGISFTPPSVSQWEPWIENLTVMRTKKFESDDVAAAEVVNIEGSIFSMPYGQATIYNVLPTCW